MPTFRQLALKGRLRKRRRCTVAALKNSPQRKGIVIKMSITTPRKPNSAKRRYARVRVLASKKLISAHPPGLGSPYIQQFSIVMVEGGSPPDTPGINYSLIRGVYDFCMPEQYSRRRRRSKFGKKQPEIGFDPVRSKKDKLKILDSLLPQKKLDISERSEFYRSQYFALENYKRNLFLSILKREKRKLKRYIRKLEEKNKKPLGKDVITLLRKDMERRSTRMSKDRYDKSLNITGFLDRKQEKYKKMRKLFRKRLKQRSYWRAKNPNLKRKVSYFFDNMFLKRLKIFEISKLYSGDMTITNDVNDENNFYIITLSPKAKVKQLKDLVRLRKKYWVFEQMQLYFLFIIKNRLKKLKLKEYLYFNKKKKILKKRKFNNLNKNDLNELKKRKLLYLNAKNNLLKMKWNLKKYFPYEKNK